LLPGELYLRGAQIPFAQTSPTLFFNLFFFRLILAASARQWLYNEFIVMERNTNLDHQQ
jgi:hypothetical protein